MTKPIATHTDPSGKTWEVIDVRQVTSADEANSTHIIDSAGSIRAVGLGNVGGFYPIARPVKPPSPFEGEGKTYTDRDGDELTIHAIVDEVLIAGVTLDDIQDDLLRDLQAHAEAMRDD